MGCLFCVSEVEKGLWVDLVRSPLQYASLDGRLGCLWSSWRVLPCGNACSNGDWPEGFNHFCLWSLELSLCDVLERCWRRWIACRWLNLVQPATWGSAMSACMPFRCHWMSVVLIVGGWPFVSRNGEKEISLGTCENGKWGDAICGFNVQWGQAVPLICWAAMDLKHKKW